MTENPKNTVLRKNKKDTQCDTPIDKKNPQHDISIGKKDNQVIRKVKLIPKNVDNIPPTQEKNSPCGKIIIRKNKHELKMKNPKTSIVPITPNSEKALTDDGDSEDSEDEIVSDTSDENKIGVKVVKVTVTKIENVPQIDGGDMVSEYSSTLRKNVSDEELSKEEMIEKVEYQRDVLVKNRDKYKEKDYSLKLSTIDKLLSKLREELDKMNLATMNEKRTQIDKIVLDKKIPEKQFVKKIDLTGDHDDKDPSMSIVTSSRKYFDKMGYLKPPPELAKIDPSKTKKGFGNQPMPTDILRSINFS
jgi:hypothetical protein